MSQVLVIARREIAEKRFVFVAAIAFALLSVMIAFMPFTGIKHPAMVIAVASAGFAIVFSLGVATILGGSIVGRDVTAGRMSFYFARPVSGVSIWFGKLIATAAMVTLTFVIVIAPAVFTGVRSLSQAFGAPDGITVALLGGTALALFVVTHAIGTMVRSRSALIAIDFVAAAVTVYVAQSFVSSLLAGAAIPAIKVLAWIGGIVIVLAFLAAGAWQVADGRTDRRRNHAAFSKVWWSGIAVLLVIAGGFTAWVVSAKPSDVEMPVMMTASSGPNALVTGTARLGYSPLFLYDVSSGNYQRLGGAWRWDADLSRDGKHLIGIERTSTSRNAGELFVRDAAPGSKWIGTSTMVSAHDEVVGTDDASRLAIVHGDTVTVYEPATKRSLGSAHLPGIHWLFFTTPGSVRIYTQNASTIASFDYDVVHRSLRRNGEIPLDAKYVRMIANEDGSRVIVSRYGKTAEFSLNDGKTLQPIAVLPKHRHAVFLRDGRIVMAASNGVLVATPDGAIAKTYDIGPHDFTTGVEDLGGGKVMICVGQRSGTMVTDQRVVVVDADRGVVRNESGLRSPNLGFYRGDGDPRPVVALPQQLMVDAANRTLIRWNALTGAKTKIAG